MTKDATKGWRWIRLLKSRVAVMREWRLARRAERRLRKDYGSLEEAWAAAATGVDWNDLSLRDDFVRAGKSCSTSYRTTTARLSGSLGTLWLEAVGLLVTVIIVVGIRGDLRGGSHVVSVRSVPALTVLDSSALGIDTMRLELGGYGSIEEVTGRVALQALPPGTVLRPEHLSRYELDAGGQSRVREGTLMSIPLIGSFAGAVTPGGNLDLIGLLGPPSPQPPADGCELFRDLLVVAVERQGSTESVVVSAPPSLVGSLGALLGRQGSTFRPVVAGSADC